MYNAARTPGGSQALFYEGYVAGVDIKRHECKIRTDYGQTINGVRWLKEGGADGYGENKVPTEKTRVLVMRLPNNNHIIMGSLGVISNDDIRAAGPAIGKQGAPNVEAANYSISQSATTSGDQSTPADQRVGDWSRTSHGGGMIALLRAGTVMMKASPTSMFMLSPFDDLGRLVTRNWEHFTDVDSTRKVSSGGAVSYSHEVFRTSARARNEQPSFREVRGGEGAVGDAGAIARREFFDDGNVLTSQQTEYINGRKHQLVQTGASIVEMDTTITGHSTRVKGGDTTYFNMDETSVHFDVAGDMSVDATKDKIVINAGGGVTFTLEKGGKLQVKTSGDAAMDIGGNLTTTAKNVTYNVDAMFKVNAAEIELG